MYDPLKENDKDVLRAFVSHLKEQNVLLEKEVNALRIEKLQDEELRHKLSEELVLIRQRIFASKEEKKANKARNQKKKKKGKLPHNQSKNIPIEDQELNLDEEIVEYKLEDSTCCPKCGSDKFSEMNNCHEESSEFEVIERRYLLKRHKRQKYACKGCSKISTAPGGVKLTPGGEFSIQIATQIVADKFEDHLPLERQRKRMKRAGVNVETKTLYGLTEHLYNRLYPLNELIRKDVLDERWIHIDESPIKFYNPKKSQGYVWSMSNPRGAYYQFEPTRSGAVAREMLTGYKTGNVVTDGFSGYSFLDAQEGINHCLCWAHVRRKFFEAMNFDPLAGEVVDLIDELYGIEHKAESINALSELRMKESSLVVNKIDEWIDSLEGHYLESTSLGKAIKYYEARKKGLHHFLSDKYAPIDNNMAERMQRCPVMGRKNFLHFKSINGADVGVFFYSVIESCKLNGLNAKAYINLMAHRSAKGEELMSPYQYSKKLTEEVSARLTQELAQIEPPSG